MAVFPELALTGYAIDDLFGQDAVLDAVHDGLAPIVEASAELLPVLSSARRCGSGPGCSTPRW